jgi:hypothetical protein
MLLRDAFCDQYDFAGHSLLRFFCDFDMFFEVLIVSFGKIASEVDSSAFPSHFGGARHKQRYREHILTLPAFGRVEDFVHYIPLPKLDDFLGLHERLSLSRDANISPYKGPKRISNVCGI